MFTRRLGGRVLEPVTSVDSRRSGSVVIADRAHAAGDVDDHRVRRSARAAARTPASRARRRRRWSRRRARRIAGVTSGTGTIAPEMPALLTSTSSAPTRLDGRGDARVVGDVELDEARAELLGGGAAARLVAGADPDVVAFGDAAAARSRSPGPVGSGDQGRGHADPGWRDRRADDQRTLSATLDAWMDDLAACLRTWRDRLAARRTPACRRRAAAARRACAARRSRSSPGSRSTTSRGSSRAAPARRRRPCSRRSPARCG